MAANGKVKVGIIGSGFEADIHAASFQIFPEEAQVVAVASPTRGHPEALAKKYGVPRVFHDYREMLKERDIEMVTINAPNDLHCAMTRDIAGAGKHVVCEKPFALRAADGDRMIDMAASRRLVLTVFQSRRWDPDYIAMREIARSGSIGEPFYLESFIGGYDHPCDLWHSHEPISGGTIYDWGSHYFDWILQLFGDTVRTIEAQAHKRVWHDVTNSDQVHVDLTFANGAQASFLQSDIAAARKPKWYLLGTDGAVVGDWTEASVPSDFPARLKVFRRTGEEVLTLPARDENGFYRNLADHLQWQEPLAVTAEEARRTVAVMEAATQSIARGGAQIKVEI